MILICIPEPFYFIFVFSIILRMPSATDFSIIVFYFIFYLFNVIFLHFLYFHFFILYYLFCNVLSTHFNDSIRLLSQLLYTAYC